MSKQDRKYKVGDIVMLETEYICGCKKEILQCGVRVGEKL